MKNRILYVMIIFSVSIHVYAQNTGAAFLVEDPAAKSFAMGSAFTAYANTPDSLILNPAGIVLLCIPSLSLSYRTNLVAGYNSAVFFTTPLNANAVLGVGITLDSLGSIDINNLDGTSYTVNAMESWTANVGYGMEFQHAFGVHPYERSK